MNLVDVTIIKILGKPKIKIFNNFCYWEINVLTACWGVEVKKTLTAINQSELSKYKIGYSWRE